MNAKRKAANPSNGANGNRYFIDEHNKGTKTDGINQAPESFTVDALPTLAVVMHTLPDAKGGDFNAMYFRPDTRIAAVYRPDREEPTLFEGRRFQIAPTSDMDTALCFLLDYFGIKRLETPNGSTSEYIRRYCEVKGIQVCRG